MNKYNKNNAFTYPGEKRDSGMEDASNGRKGIAKELLSRVVNDARDYGCGTIQITASDMGVKLSNPPPAPDMELVRLASFPSCERTTIANTIHTIT